MTDPGPARRRPLLPLLDSLRHGSRSHTTCWYKCGNACDAPVPNRTDNPTIAEVVEGAFSRRSMLKAAGAGALVVAVGPLASAAAAEMPGGDGAPAPDGPLTFEPVQQNLLDELVTAAGYEHAVVLRWGDPVERDAPDFDVDAQTAEAQARQFGYNCDFLGLLPLGRDGHRGLLVVNHEYTDEQLMFAGVADEEAPTTDEQKRIAMMAHGLSVVEVRRTGTAGAWEAVPRGKRNRRLTAMTPFELTGPVAGSEYVRTSADPGGRRVLGTLNNCAGGMTPWGTTLHGEENVYQYFGATTPVTEDPREPRYTRYGITVDEPAGRRWHVVDPRFDITVEPNEPKRFGFIVELDPYDPASTPKKRTALGRFKHEGANVHVAEDGRVVAYSGDDERFEYVYKFVSRRRYRPGTDAASRAHNMTLLEDGDLYVARFTGDSPPEQIDGVATVPADGEFDGTGQWVPLVRGGQSMVPGRSVAWVLTFTRLAADRLGKELDAAGDFPDPAAPVVVDPSKVPTRMDRPEDIQVNPVNGRVYAALTTTPSARSPTRPTRWPGRSRSTSRRGPTRSAPATATATCWSGRRPTGSTVTTSTGGCSSSPVTRTTPRRSSPASTSRESAPCPARTTWSSTRPGTCGSPPTATPCPRWTRRRARSGGRTTGCSPSRRPARSGGTSRPSSPSRWAPSAAVR